MVSASASSSYDTNFSAMNVLLKQAPLPSAYKRLVNPLLRRLLHTVQVVLERLLVVPDQPPLHREKADAYV
jgi:hypothetical protein